MSNNVIKKDTGALSAGNMAKWALILIWVGMLGTSTSSIFVRYSNAPSLVMAAWRKNFVTLLLLPVVLGKRSYREELRRLDRKTVLWCMLSGLFLAFHFWTYFEGVHMTTIAASQVLVGLEVLFVAVVMFFTGQEKYNHWAKAGILIALLGSVVVAYSRGGFSGGSMLAGNIIEILSASLIAVYSLIGKKVRTNVSNNVYTFLVYGTSALILDVIVLLSPHHFLGYERINYWCALGMAVFCSLMGHSIFNWALKYQSPTILAMVKIIQPVFASVWAFMLFAERPLWNHFVGGIVVMLGIFLYVRHQNAEA